MIPISLSLQNFLSYGENVPHLDFSGFHVACISGRNGHGKSALLDAITWALWGEARKPGSERRPNEGLLRIGTTEMQVDFEFHLEGDRYRVSRSFRKTGKSATSRLELQVFSTETGGYKTLSEEGAVRKTQERINTLLRMTYETFINSAFLLQGRADEFTRRKASERKAILSDILGLSQYDELASLARGHAHQGEVDRATTLAKRDEIEQALSQRKDFVQQRTDLDTQLQACNDALQTAEEQLEGFRQTLTQRERQTAERDALQNDLKRITSEIQKSQTEYDTAQKEVESYKIAIDQRPAILQAIGKQQALQKEDADLQHKLHTQRPLEQRAVALDKKITEQRHEVERRLGEWDVRIREAERELRETEALLSNQETIRIQIDTLRKAQEQDREWETLRENKERIENSIRELERQIETASKDLQVTINTRSEQLKQTEDLAAQFDRRQETVQNLQTQNAQLQQLETQRDQVRDKGSALKIQIDTDRDRLKSLLLVRQETEQQQHTMQNVQEADCPLCGSTLDETHRNEVTAKLAEQLQQQQTQIAEAETNIQQAETGREQHRRQYQDIKNQLAQNEQLARDLATAESALKESENAVQSQKTLSAEFEALKIQLVEHTQNSPDARALSQARQDLENLAYNPAEHRTLREKLKELESVEAQNAQLQVAEERQQKTLAELPEFRTKRDLAQQWLTESKYAPEEQTERDAIQKQIQELNYNSAHHQEISRQLANLQDAPAQYERLQAAERELENTETRLNTLKEQLASLTKTQGETQDRLTQLTTAIDQAKSAIEQYNALQKTIDETRTRRDQLLQQHATLQAQIERCDALQKEQKDVEDKLKTSEHDIHVYRELTKAFGKDGIQALIIEQAIPEIEEEANKILSRLTDNRTQIALESLRDLKTGGTRETLDIKISDELGERSYELYSGGEAFRVDFAIRIALSKLLASRTGTSLRTLVIDEGFGTQDAEGLDHLVEAIQAISQDFEKILVITHVESLKQAFPVRIEVTKYPDLGSRFEVLY